MRRLVESTIAPGVRAEQDEDRTYTVTITVPGGANDRDMAHYARAALEDYGPFIGLSERLPHGGGIKLIAMKPMEDKMARLRGRSASIKMDLPREVDAEEVAGFLLEAIDHEEQELPDEDPMKGVAVRAITFDGEKFDAE